LDLAKSHVVQVPHGSAARATVRQRVGVDIDVNAGGQPGGRHGSLPIQGPAGVSGPTPSWAKARTLHACGEPRSQMPAVSRRVG
jgi:hypothetical protein